LRLTKIWKIRIIGLIIAMIGLSLWGANVFEIWYNIGSRESAETTFYFAIIFGVGMLILYCSDHLRRVEKKNLQQIKE
jgi:predicted tellurium resistance membrane protein TerC